jgi:putative glutathione S-transferase
MVELTSEDGEVQREETSFRGELGTDELPVEPGRYHLYVSLACPWAHRTLVTRVLRSLEDAVSVDVLDPYRDERGWQFTPGKPGCTPDTVNGFDYLHEVYAAADSNYTGHVTTPVLWDCERETIVNNESREIMHTLDAAFEGNGATLYPKSVGDTVGQIIDEIYEPINNGVYRAGFANSQAAYDAAVEELFTALDKWDSVLSERRYLAGERLTAAAVAMFTTLVRFDMSTTPISTATVARSTSTSISGRICVISTSSRAWPTPSTWTTSPNTTTRPTQPEPDWHHRDGARSGLRGRTRP